MKQHREGVCEHFRGLNRVQLMHVYFVLFVKGKLAEADLDVKRKVCQEDHVVLPELGVAHFLEKYPPYPLNLRVKYVDRENTHFEWCHHCAPIKDRELNGLYIMQNITLDDPELWDAVGHEMKEWRAAKGGNSLKSTLFTGVRYGDKHAAQGTFAFFKATGMKPAFFEAAGVEEECSEHELLDYLDAMHIRMLTTDEGTLTYTIELCLGLMEVQYNELVSKYRYSLKLHMPEKEEVSENEVDLATCLNTALESFEVWDDIMTCPQILDLLGNQDASTYCLLSDLKGQLRGEVLDDAEGIESWLEVSKPQPATAFFFNLPDPWVYLKADISKKSHKELGLPKGTKREGAASFWDALTSDIHNPSTTTYTVGVLQACRFDIAPTYLMTMIEVNEATVTIRDSTEGTPDAVVARVGGRKQGASLRYKSVTPLPPDTASDVWARAAEFGKGELNPSLESELRGNIAERPAPKAGHVFQEAIPGVTYSEATQWPDKAEAARLDALSEGSSQWGDECW